MNGVVTDTVEYTYGNAYWSDRLTAINVNGTSKNISYATYLNPSSWYNGTQFTNLTWTQGRRLSSITKGSQTYSYEYDMAGARTSKVANGLRHEYVTQNGRIVREIVTNASTGAFQYALDFTYDEAGHPLTMRKYNNANMQNNYITMQYVCNAQCDVVKLIYNGTVYAEYTYDAWGNVLTATENGSYNYAALNPLRYRGYYYDSETGFYYLQSRYYDPMLKRFLSADKYLSTGHGFLGFNAFAYCINNPLRFIDESGNEEGVLEWWAATMWWLCGADGPIPIGDIIYAGGAVILFVVDLALVEEVAETPSSTLSQAKTDSKTKTPSKTASSSTPADPNNNNNKKKNESRRSEKEKASDRPSWVDPTDVDPNLSPQQNATRMLNDKYGIGNWKKGPGSEFSQIVKWIQRCLRYYMVE